MKKYIFLLFSFLVFAITANAQYKMVITLANGEKIEKEVWDIQNVAFEPLGSVATPDVQEAVDLGLSVKWAPMNFGATAETSPGYYVGWGDATGLNKSTVLNYFPVLHPTSDIVNGNYDIVHVLWGDQWRMPTLKEVNELIENCDWTYDETRKGWKVASRKDPSKSIFLPMQGYRNGTETINDNSLGAYWTGSLNKTDDQKASALVLHATDNATGDYLRYMGLQIRPVYGPFYEGAKVKGVSVTNVSMNDAYVKVTFEGGYADASKIGLCYGTTSSVDPDQNNKVTAEAADIAEDGTYTFHVSNLDPNTTYYFAGYIVCQGQRSLGATSYLKTKAKFPVAEMVDLGLSVKWAKWNIGASSEDEYGSYIAWGDPTGEDQSFDNSHYPNAYSDISGTKYDVATTQWGDKWRMPTPDEWKELDGLTKQLVTLNNGNKVFKVTAKNGNYIYLPRGGYQTRKGKQDVNTGADYWTSKNTSQTTAEGVQVKMISSIFEPEDEKGWHMLVRPVYGDKQAGPDAPNVDTRDLTAEGKLAKGVDLGLSVKWATYNLGAKSETEPGSYFSWATTAAGSDFSLSQYKWYDASTGNFNIPSTNISDTDNDAAVKLWGGTWRMPTDEEINELVNNCTWTQTDGGFKIKGKNGNEIFLPFTGFYNGSSSLSSDNTCYYWSGSYNDLPVHAEDHWAYYLTNYSSTPVAISSYIYCGMCIRPVCAK